LLSDAMWTDGENGITSWQNEHTHAEVLAAWDRAIKMADGA